MREIKFRAWDEEVKNGSWMIYDSTTHISLTWEIEWHIPWVLMQYTWLEDKDGEEIYEGDILEDHRPKLKWMKKYNKIIEDIRHLPFIVYSDYKVIGNIYQNPELIW